MNQPVDKLETSEIVMRLLSVLVFSEACDEAIRKTKAKEEGNEKAS